MATKITKLSITNDKISGRGGLALILRYIAKTQLCVLISSVLLTKLKLHPKGLQLEQFLKQVFANLFDGTDMTMTGFDARKNDSGYAAVLENKMSQMASSHQIKRFFSKLSIIPNKLFRKILHELFIWRLRIEKPQILILGIDTMVMDNDYAKKREGCEPTYKRKKGFQPLHICWGPYLIDVVFRIGSAHSNHGTDYIDSVTDIVKLIRTRYSQEIPIILCADSGFADQKAFACFENELKIHYIVTNKLYNDIKAYIQDLPLDGYSQFSKNKAMWKFIEFGNKLKSWTRFRRCIFTKLMMDQNGQYLMDLAKPDSVISTNIGLCKEADDRLLAAGGEKYFEAQTIISLAHERGADELIHRSIKELATKEQLPFKSFGMNQAYYYLLVFAHFMFESYKRDITPDIIPITAYPNTFRRKLIDFAVKITSRSRSIIMSVTRTIYETINIEILWKRCQSPPVIQFC
ncbi:MAG: IS1380 family transposase [Bacteroidales bacterium]|nr:IS1380 family transposase [Bacteroidales bacterium]